MEYSCKEFKVGKCEGEKLVDGETMPLVLKPPEPTKNGIEYLLGTLNDNKEWFDEMIAKNSAVLLRGFDVKDDVEFNDIVETCGWEKISGTWVRLEDSVSIRGYGPLMKVLCRVHLLPPRNGSAKYSKKSKRSRINMVSERIFARVKRIPSCASCRDVSIYRSHLLENLIQAYIRFKHI